MMAAPPYPLVDNPGSLLDVADLVFIDPPGTGFSQLTKGTDPKKYYGLKQDGRAVADVIRRWINDNGRWSSPKYPRRGKLWHQPHRDGGG